MKTDEEVDREQVPEEYEAECSTGWEERCMKSKSPRKNCKCACGGVNHGRARFTTYKRGDSA